MLQYDGVPCCVCGFVPSVLILKTEAILQDAFRVVIISYGMCPDMHLDEEALKTRKHEGSVTYVSVCALSAACKRTETVLERKPELSESELLDLLHSFAAMGRWFFDNRVLDQLTAVLVDRARAGEAGQHSVERVAECLAGINHKNKALLAYMQECSSSSSSTS